MLHISNLARRERKADTFPLEARIAFGVVLRELSGIKPAVLRDSLRWKPNHILRGLVSLPVQCPPARGTFDMNSARNAVRARGVRTP